MSGQRVKLKHFGVPLTAPADVTRETLDAELEKFRMSPEFYQMVDKKTGARTDIRRAVQAAPTAEDRLATLRMAHPEAVPYGEDNFLFLNPETGRPTLFDETRGGAIFEGFTLRDIVDAEKDIFVGAASVVGTVAAGGATFGTASTVGAAGSAVAADVAYDWWARNVYGTKDTRSFTQSVADRALVGAFAAGGEVVGGAVTAGVGRFAKKVMGGDAKGRAQMIYEAMDAHNISRTGGMVTGGRGGASVIESALQQGAGSRAFMQEQIEKTLIETENAVFEVAKKFGRPQSQQELGIAMQKAAEASRNRFGAMVSKLEKDLTGQVGEDTLFPVDNLRALVQKWQKTGVALPEYSEATTNIAHKKAMALLNDGTRGGGIPYSRFREARTDFRVSHEGELRGSGVAFSGGVYKEVYDAMSADLLNGVDNVGIKVGKQYRDAMAKQAAWHEENDKLLAKVIDMDAPEKIYRFLVNERKDGATIIAKMRTEFTDEEWQDVSATVLNKMGFPNLGNQDATDFSVNTFMTNWSRTSKEAKDVFFGGPNAELRKELDRLVEVIDSIADAAKTANFSNTSQAANALDLMNALGFDTTNIAMAALTGKGDGVIEAAKGLLRQTVGRIVFPAWAAKLITSPAFVRWLASPIKKGTKSELGGKMGQLMALAYAHPEIAPEIQELINAMNTKGLEQ